MASRGSTAESSAQPVLAVYLVEMNFTLDRRLLCHVPARKNALDWAERPNIIEGHLPVWQIVFGAMPSPRLASPRNAARSSVPAPLIGDSLILVPFMDNTNWTRCLFTAIECRVF